MSLLSINMVSFPFLFYRFGQVAFLTFSPIIPASFTDVTIPVANTFGESGPPLDSTKTYRFVASSGISVANTVVACCCLKGDIRADIRAKYPKQQELAATCLTHKSTFQ